MKLRHLFASAALLASASLPAWAGQDIQLKEAPKPVRKTIEHESKKGQVLDIEREFTKDGTVYEVEVTQEGAKFELLIASDGMLISRNHD